MTGEPFPPNPELTYEQILAERDGPVVLVTLNRPDQMNAWTFRMHDELGDVFARAEEDDSVRAIVVTGAGKAFCAGADLSEGGGTFAGESKTVGKASARERSRPSQEMNTPIIAAINGAAVGAGLTMPMIWDLRVAAEDAKLGFVFNRRGVVADGDLLWRIPRMIGYGPAMELLLTGRTFTGREARELGLVHRAVPAGEVLSSAMELAHDIAANTAPATVAITKRLMYEFLGEAPAEAAKRQLRAFRWSGRQPDVREGVMAFLERRVPRWGMSKRVDLDEITSSRSSDPD